MNALTYDCDCDTVIEMEDVGVSVKDILQYALVCLPERDVRVLMHGLEGLLDRSAACSGGRRSSVTDVRTACSAAG